MINQNPLENYVYTPNRNPWREFVSEMWYQHKDEILTWTNKAVTDYDIKDYYHRNKWFLKKQFKTQKRKTCF